MAAFCDRCGKEIFPFDNVCPFCGQIHQKTEADEMTVPGLRAACARYGITPESYGFSIGQQTAFPGTGAIYRDNDGGYVLERVREDGTREILSEGTEEKLVAEAFVRVLKESWLKRHPGYRLPGAGGAPAAAKAPSFFGTRHGAMDMSAKASEKDPIRLRTRVLGALLLIFVLLSVYYFIKADKNDGYYTLNGVTYVYYHDTWYEGGGSEWKPTGTPEGFSWKGDWEYDTIREGGFADSPYYQPVTWSSLWRGGEQPRPEEP